MKTNPKNNWKTLEITSPNKNQGKGLKIGSDVIGKVFIIYKMTELKWLKFWFWPIQTIIFPPFFIRYFFFFLFLYLDSKTFHKNKNIEKN